MKTIKNKIKKHYIKKRNGTYRYICMQTVSITKIKATRTKSLVSCKNCINLLDKGLVN